MVHQNLLVHAGVYTSWRYCHEPCTERPQRAFALSDTGPLTDLIKQVSQQYQVAKQQHGAGADFKACKDAILKEWNSPCPLTRNLYSSVIATYFTWRRREQRSGYKKKLPHLKSLVRWLEFITNGR